MSVIPANVYSASWFEVFLDTMPEALTDFEVDALARRLPRPGFESLLDICCGPARHTRPLAARGYRVTGVDRDAAAVERARDLAPAAKFVELDQREPSSLTGTFDGAVIMWQSFGYFDEATNGRILADVAALLRPGGRLLLDLFHREYFVARQGQSTDTRDPRCLAITNEMSGHRLTSTIEYADGSSEQMDFELFTPSDIEARAAPAGFELVEACCWWDADRPPTADEQRFQVVFERSG